MKVYYSKFNRKCPKHNRVYGGGMILVAANSPEEALKIAFENSDYKVYMQDWDKENKRYVPKADWITEFKEIPYVEFTLNIPMLLKEDMYVE